MDDDKEYERKVRRISRKLDCASYVGWVWVFIVFLMILSPFVIFAYGDWSDRRDRSPEPKSQHLDSSGGENGSSN